MSLMNTLGLNPQFESLSNAERMGVEAAMSVRTYRDGHVFMREGEPGDALYLILDGEVLATRAVDAQHNRVLATMSAGDLFGHLALIDDAPRTATCVAAGPVVAASLPRARFVELYKADAPAAYTFQHMLALQLVHDVRLMNAALMRTLLGPDAVDPSGTGDGKGSAEYQPIGDDEELDDDDSTQ